MTVSLLFFRGWTKLSWGCNGPEFKESINRWVCWKIQSYCKHDTSRKTSMDQQWQLFVPLSFRWLLILPQCFKVKFLGSIGWFLGEELAFCGFSLSGLVIDLEDCSQLRNRTNVQPVYGWDYSDEKLIWPNNDILYLYGKRHRKKTNNLMIIWHCIDYPEFLTISSNSTAAGLYPRLMGPYKRTNDNSFTQFQNSGYRNGRPIWEHLYTNAFIYLNGKIKLLKMLPFEMFQCF